MDMNEVICRLCMSNKQLSSIFNFVNGDEISFSTIAVECNLIQIQPDDGLSSYICEICKCKLHNLHIFKLQCLETEFKLKERKKNVHSHVKIKNEPELTGSYLNASSLNINKSNCVKNENYSESQSKNFKNCHIKLESVIEKNIPKVDDFENVNPEHTVTVPSNFDKAFPQQNNGELLQENFNSRRENEMNFNTKSNTQIRRIQKKKSIIDNLNKKESHCFKVQSQSNSNQSIDYSSDKNEIGHLKSKSVSEQIEKSLKPFQCEHCGQVFRLKCILKKHMTTHTSVKLFMCPICPKSYTRDEHRVVHMRLHTGIRPYICEECARSFIKVQDLKRHRRIHSDERKYSCTRCDKKFKRSGDVHAHMRTHTGIRPFRCKVCSKTYTSHSGLRKHSHGSQCKSQLSTKDEKLTSVLNMNNSALMQCENNS